MSIEYYILYLILLAVIVFKITAWRTHEAKYLALKKRIDEFEEGYLRFKLSLFLEEDKKHNPTNEKTDDGNY